MKSYELVTGYSPGLIGRVSELHSIYYSEHWGFEKYFEIKIANDYDEVKDRVFSLFVEGKIKGSISIYGSSESLNIAHLRWFIISEKLRGKGAGNELMQQAITVSREKDYDSVYLWTFKGLGSARHLYEKYGFSLTEENSGEQWGAEVIEQCFDSIF